MGDHDNYHSWGFGGNWNRFADGVHIGGATLPPSQGLIVDGKVGIGTNGPSAKLDVAGSLAVGHYTVSASGYSSAAFGYNSDANTNYSFAAGLNTDANGYGSIAIGNTAKTTGNKSIALGSSVEAVGYRSVAVGLGGSSSTCQQNNAMCIQGGNVGIGTGNPDKALTVNGTVKCEELLVDSVGADFVFEDDYALMPLSELESFVQGKRHLPEIPPAADMQKNGMSVGDVQTKLLQKIEELTLYTIAQQKEIDDLRGELRQLLASARGEKK